MDISGIRSFIRSYSPSKAVVVTKDHVGKLEVNGGEVIFIPACLLS